MMMICVRVDVSRCDHLEICGASDVATKRLSGSVAIKKMMFSLYVNIGSDSVCRHKTNCYIISNSKLHT
jgi:hypothetical protein